LRDHAASKNPQGFAGAERAVERAAGGDLADHLQARTRRSRIDRSHRIAIHRRHRLRRLGAQRRDVARQHPVPGGIERDQFFGQWLGARENRFERIGNRHQCHGESPRLAGGSGGRIVGDF
jgi:hypothetical protein